MAARNLRLRYRPIRIGWCVRDGSLEDVRRVLKLTHTLWGGSHNPVIPVGGSLPAKALVELYRVDALYPALEDASLRTFIGKFPHFRWPLFEKDLFVNRMGGGKLPTLLDVYHPVRKIFEEFVKKEKDPKSQATIFTWSELDPLADFFLAFFGAYPAQTEIGKDYGGFIAKYLHANKIEFDRGKPIPADAFREFTPSGICGFELLRDRLPNWDYPGVYWGSLQTFEDVVNFWNLRAADLDLVFFDPAHEGRLSQIADAYVQVLSARPKDSMDLDTRPAVWFREGTEIDGRRFPRANMQVRVGDGLWNGLNLKPPVMYISDKSVLGAESEYGDSLSVSFELREKPFFDDLEISHQHLVITVKPFTYGEEGEATFKFPFIPELNEFYRRSVSAVREARSEPNGLGIITKVTSSDLRINAVSRRSLVTQIFEVFGITSKPSEAGRIASRLIQQMGGLQGCRVFKIAGVRELIEKYKPLQSFSRTEAIQVIGQADPNTGIPNFAAYEDLYIEHREGGKLKPHHVFEYLLKHNVFRVGIRFTCPHCELQFWTHLDDVATELTCEYCGQRFNVTAQLRDSAWAYRRSGLFGREDHQQGAIPVAMTLQQLDIALNTEMVYVTSMTLEPASADIEPCESDFVIVSDRGFGPEVEVAIGESKSRGEITEEDVRKLARVADVLSNKRIVTYIVFAKSSRFTPVEIARCRLAQPRGRSRVILLSDRELEPYFVYERAEKEFHIPGVAVCLEDLAHNTHALYFDPHPKAPA
jgi:hypothetical protein